MARRERDAFRAERDELRLTLLAEQGDPAGAPSEGWLYDTGWWSAAEGRRAGRRPFGGGRHGDRSCWWWDAAEMALGTAPTAREAMVLADAAALGDER